MTDEQIVKDLECYIDEADGFYATDVLKNALDLLKRQRVTIEKLQNALFKQEDTIQMIVKEKDTEIEKLKENNKYLDDCLRTTYRIIGEMVGD